MTLQTFEREELKEKDKKDKDAKLYEDLLVIASPREDEKEKQERE
eukprot:CAMPEP_0201521908 /NCGR_PEP_ID=MMETSP0161_2-20130828/16347_1 /ASSEMBLY_ACC=CAM_ASM_000251 /TAXON_ID=180227 /ORGANISM="Neoparamoeba aestuarina, Strain SoJaBio B1-5/56/2" /LENGTH=44 /DNA_ID= /DNA_START= /DNA_END= /DNA_ORIENTATION=